MSGHHPCEENDGTATISDAVVNVGPLSTAPAVTAVPNTTVTANRMVSSGTTTNAATAFTATTTVSSSAKSQPPSKLKSAPDERSSETISLQKTRTEPSATTTTTTTTHITEPGPDDVLLGRGAPIINYVGNVKFRSLVRSRKNDYVTSGRHKIKDKVAKSILREIHRRGGRFLKRVEVPKTDVAEDIVNPDQHQTAPSDGNTGSTSQEKDVKMYQIADYDVALEKVKQALRDKDTDQQYLTPLQDFQHHQHQQQRPNEDATEASQQLLLEEVAAASGISTLTALQQQLYETIGNNRRSALQLNYPVSTTSSRSSSSSSNLFPLPFDPSRNLSHMNELLRYQQLQSVPIKIQERRANTEQMNLLNQELRVQESQRHDHQTLLAMLRQNANDANRNDIHNESIQRPLSTETIMSLLHQSNDHALRNAERGNNSTNLEDYLQQTNQQYHSNLLSTMGNRNARNISTHDLLLQQQLTNVNNRIPNLSNLFGNQNDRLSQLAANLVAQRQHEQYNTALLAHAASMNKTSNVNLDMTSRITQHSLPDSLSLSNNVLGPPLLSDGAALAQSSPRANASQIIPLLTRGKVGQHHAPTFTSTDSAGHIEPKKRKSSNDHDNKTNPKSSTAAPANTTKTTETEVVESVKHHKKSKLE